MTTITEDYVSFETAKLLKEKGFDEKCFALYNPNGTLIQSGIKLNNTQVGRVKGSYSASTLQMAMKWLREVHGLFIHIGNDDLDYWWQIEDVLNKNDNYDPICKSESYGGNRTYEEAVEAAIKYCLENLI